MQYGLEALNGGPDHARGVRRPQREGRRPDIDCNRRPRARSAAEHGARRSPTAPARSPTRASSRTCRSSTCAATARREIHTDFHSYACARGSTRPTATTTTSSIWTCGQAPILGVVPPAPVGAEVVPAHGQSGCRDRGGPRGRPAGAEGPRRQARRRRRRLLHGGGADGDDRHGGLRAAFPHYADARLAPAGRSRTTREVPAAAARPGDYSVTFTDGSGRGSAGVPERRLRLSAARSASSRDPVAHLRGRPRRAARRAGARVPSGPGETIEHRAKERRDAAPWPR